MKRSIIAVFIVMAAVPMLVHAQTKQDSLASLIQVGNRKAAIEKIRAGTDVNAAQPDGTRPIHWAVFRVDHELVDMLIAKKAKVDVANEFGSTPLTEAVKLMDARVVKALLGAGANPESPNPDNQTALMFAIKTGELPVVEMLIQAGANVNTMEKFHNQTPLMWAAAATRNAGAMVKLLIAKGANVKPRALYSDWPSQITSEPRAQYRPTGGLNALLYAARGGCYECVEALANAGADVNLPTPEGVTPLMTALDNGSNSVAKLLLDKGASPHLWDWWGRTALYIAVDRKAAAAVPVGRGGLGAGAQFGGSSGSGAPVARTAGPVVSSMDIINALLAASVDPSPQMNMHRPSRGGNSGRFVDPLLNTGCTPLLRAVMANDTEVVRALLAKGASPNINDMGMTAFLVAAGVGFGGRGTGLAAAASAGSAPNFAMMDLLVQGGADVNAQITGSKTYSMRIARSPSVNEGMTALHSAAQGGRTDLARYLIEKGASTAILDSNGRKPIDLIAATAQAAGGAAPRGGPSGPNPATATELRSLLENAAASKK